MRTESNGLLGKSQAACCRGVDRRHNTSPAELPYARLSLPTKSEAGLRFNSKSP